MSSEAVNWAMRQHVTRTFNGKERPLSSARLTLIALCSFHDHRSQIVRLFPSLQQLVARANQDRKTVVKNLDVLEGQGLIQDTGERVGKTKQIKVYSADFGTVPKTEPFQDRNSSKIAQQESQKRDTELPLEPSASSEATPLQKQRARATSKHGDEFPRPEWADPQVWADFLKNRKRKRLANTPTAHRMFLAEAERISALFGWTKAELLEFCTAKGAGSIFEPGDQFHGRFQASRGDRFAAASSRAIGPTEAATLDSLDFGNSEVGSDLEE